MALQLSKEELSHVRLCVMVKDMWDVLKNRHEKQGPISQILLLQEALAIRYSHSVPFAETIAHIDEVNEHLRDMGPITHESIHCIIHLFALGAPEMQNVRNSITNGISASTTENPFSIEQIVHRLETEQKILASDNASTGDALAYLLQPEHLAIAVPPSAEAHFMSLDSDDVESLVLPMVAASLTDSDLVELAWLATQEDMFALVDWADISTPVDFSGITISPVADGAHRAPILSDLVPFLLNSACTTHISPERADFFSLHLIANCSVRGVGGTSIHAVGLGSICLSIGKGNTIVLDNVLYIPSSTVRLISIACLADSLQCHFLFDSASISIMTRSGSVFASSTRLPSRNLY
ncbi:hypothetical protein BD779DRAFT_1474708 [Infundibulicybe gibba]|nr:hypothetical protein BD779DRAFT_1474708 [Infundibulicybe gibba]